MRTYALLLGASALSMSMCDLALAAAPNNNDSDSVTLETVVVTAQHRSENLMQTPISASVITGDQLTAKNIVQVEDLQFVAPQVTVNDFGQGINFNIRGIGKGEHNTQTMTGVITYRDGTPTFPGYITEEPYYDIAGIEIDRGPQGTFVGQNATGGAVLVTTNNPQIGGDYNGYALASLGNYGYVGAQGAVNIPISDTFAARIATDLERRDTYATITTNGQDYKGMEPLKWAAMRLSLFWKPTDNWSILFKTDWAYLDNGGYPASPYYENCKNFTPADAFSGIVGSPSAVGCNSTTPNPHYTGDPLKFTANDPNKGLDKMTRNTLKIEYTLPNNTVIRSVSSYQLGNTMYGTDLDATDYGNLLSATRGVNQIFYDRVGESIWTQEINIISPSDQRITWILGAFAQADRYNWTKPWQFVTDTPPGTTPHADPLNPALGPNQFKLQGSTPNAAWAVFGQVTGKLFGGLEAQVGWRWSTNRSKNDVDMWLAGTGLLESVQTVKSYSFDYKAALNWTINDTNYVYGFIATGYKPGGLNTPFTVGVLTTPAFGPERVTSYEVGYKTTMLDGHVRAQFDGYYNEYKNFQVSVGYPEYPTFYYEVNSPNPTIMYGFEAELEAVFGNFSTSAGLGWSHSQIGQFWTTDPRAPSSYLTGWPAGYPATAVLPCDPVKGPQYASYWTFGNKTCINLKGHPQTYAPSLTANLGVEYKFELGGGDALTPRLSYSHMGPQWATLFDNRNYGDRLGVRNLIGAQLEWKHDTYVLTAYGTNLTDSHYVAAMNSNLNYAGAPRQYGIRLLKVF